MLFLRILMLVLRILMLVLRILVLVLILPSQLRKNILYEIKMIDREKRRISYKRDQNPIKDTIILLQQPVLQFNTNPFFFHCKLYKFIYKNHIHIDQFITISWTQSANFRIQITSSTTDSKPTYQTQNLTINQYTAKQFINPTYPNNPAEKPINKNTILKLKRINAIIQIKKARNFNSRWVPQFLRQQWQISALNQQAACLSSQISALNQ